jgi:hypothetical protein
VIAFQTEWNDFFAEKQNIRFGLSPQQIGFDY